MKKTFYYFFLFTLTFTACGGDDDSTGKIDYPTTFEYAKVELGKTHLYLLDGVGGYKELTTIPKRYLWAMDSIKAEAQAEPDFVFEAKTLTLKDDKNMVFKTFDGDELSLLYTTKGALFAATVQDLLFNFEYNQPAKTMGLLFRTHFSYSTKIKALTAPVLDNSSSTDVETELKTILTNQKGLKNDTLCLNLGKVIYVEK